MRRAAIGPVLAVVLALAACGSGGSSAASTGPATQSPATRTTAPAPSPTPATPTATAPTASPVDTATPDPSSSSTSTPSPTPSATQAVPVTGYGARLAVWASTHQADERFDPGAMWDPTAGWGPDEADNDKFNDMTVTGGRVLRFDMFLPRGGVTAAKAIAFATATLPNVAMVLWRRQLPACYVVQLSSVALGSVLAAKPFADPQGQVQLQLRSGTPTSAAATFDPLAVTAVLVRPAKAASAAGVATCS